MCHKEIIGDIYKKKQCDEDIYMCESCYFKDNTDEDLNTVKNLINILLVILTVLCYSINRYLAMIPLSVMFLENSLTVKMLILIMFLYVLKN